MNEVRSIQTAFRAEIAALLLLALGLTAASCVEVRDPGTDGPQDAGQVVVTAGTDPASVFEGGSIELNAEVEQGEPPYLFRWDQNDGPAVVITNPASATASVENLAEPGRYVFRVTATDADGFHASDFIAVEVLSSVEVEEPEYALVGEPVTLTAEVADESIAPTFLWEVVEGTALLGSPSSSTTTLTAQRGETLRVRLTVAFAGDDRASASRELEIVAVPDLTPEVRVESSMGEFVIELDGENAPKHMVNFLQYVDEGFYDGLLFHRNACTENPDTDECEPFVIQGGGYRRADGELVEVEPTHDPVEQENETSRSNGVLYSVALALRGGNANSGTSQFFINLDEENAFLDDSGFTVFGLVVEGTAAIDAIAASERIESEIIPGEVSQPAEDVVIEKIERVE